MALLEAIRVNVAVKIDQVRESRLEGNAPADHQIALCAIFAVIALGWRPPVQSAEDVKYVPCRYVLFAGEGGGCIANAVDDGYCKPHADALRELERETSNAPTP